MARQILAGDVRYNQAYDKEYTSLVSQAAGSAVNTAGAYSYVDMRFHRKFGLQLDWTAGGAGGTITITLEGSVQNAATETAAASLTFVDITNATFGVASWTDDFLALDNTEKLAGYSWLRVKRVVTNKDAATEIYLDCSKVG